uniref:Uncharacterized protein n=1 Tax=viral metagenome TaxID=1070528 RepID=A0A6C0H4K9_9ZZZZ
MEDNDIAFKTGFRRVVHDRYVYHDYIIIIYKNGNIIVRCKEYDESQKTSFENEILKIEDNIPIPEIYLNIIKQFWSERPLISPRMNKIIDNIKDIKEKIKNEITNKKTVIDLSLSENENYKRLMANIYLLELKLQEKDAEILKKDDENLKNICIKENQIMEKEHEIHLMSEKLLQYEKIITEMKNEIMENKKIIDDEIEKNMEKDCEIFLMREKLLQNKKIISEKDNVIMEKNKMITEIKSLIMK